MRHAYILAALLAGCATTPKAPAPQVLDCTTAPQWTLTDKDGRPAQDVFICFRSDRLLVYDVRPHTVDLTPVGPMVKVKKK